MKKNSLILIAAGGTAGHVNPGLALAQELKKRGSRVHFVIQKKKSIEDHLKKFNAEYSVIAVKGWNRRWSFEFVVVLFAFIHALFQTVKIMRVLQPAMVVGMGGYVALPVIIIARLFSIPVVIHEQNAYPGLSNRLTAPMAQKIAVGFEETRSFFPAEKTVYTGNPLRTDFELIPRDVARKKLGFLQDDFVVFVFGGSQGASSINKGMIDALPYIASAGIKKPSFIHITGDSDYNAVNQGYRKNSFIARTYTFNFDMNILFSACDLVISRAGAGTINEIIYAEKPAILVPYPFAADNHQTKNAAYLFRAGCAEVIENKNISGMCIAEAITGYMKNTSKLAEMSSRFKPLKQKVLSAAYLLGDVLD